MSQRRVCFVGTGFIAHAHAEALAQVPGARLHAVVDVNPDTARRFAERWRVPNVHATVEEAIGSGAVDCAHVLVPPALHRSVAEPFLDKRISVLLEKPLATSSPDCEALTALAANRGAILAINQNYVFNPAFTRLKDMVDERRLGRLLAVQALYSMPLRQVAARQFGHWMFQEPLNILLEQAIHPLSQVVALVGQIDAVSGSAGPPVPIAPGMSFFPEVTVSLRGAKAPAQLHFAVGRSFGIQQITAICDDGMIIADVLNNRLVPHTRTKWADVIDALVSGGGVGKSYVGESVRNAADYMLTLCRLRARRDPFFVSMCRSIVAFHTALDRGGQPPLDGQFGADMVRLCERIAETAFKAPPGPSKAPAPSPTRTTNSVSDVTLLGGTGFIGTHTVRRLTDAGLTITVAARSIRNLAPEFHHPHVRLVRADAGQAQDVEQAIGKCPVVVNLAHGGSGSDWPDTERRMVGSARTVAEVCLRQGTRRLIHVSSIAALYLGDASATILDSTPPDPEPQRRADYARGKVAAETMLLDMHARLGLPVCILRPGVVVGEGSSPFHSGLGVYNNDQHCLGWNAGKNPLPFVLVEDVAEAIRCAIAASGIEGHCYNLVGDTRMGAAEYVRELAAATERPLRFHAQSVAKLYSVEIAKWLIKTAVGRTAAFPSLRDLRSRGLVANIDCGDAKRALGWAPVADRATFVARAIKVHGST